GGTGGCRARWVGAVVDDVEGEVSTLDGGVGLLALGLGGVRQVGDACSVEHAAGDLGGGQVRDVTHGWGVVERARTDVVSGDAGQVGRERGRLVLHVRPRNRATFAAATHNPREATVLPPEDLTVSGTLGNRHRLH